MPHKKASKLRTASTLRKVLSGLKKKGSGLRERMEASRVAGQSLHPPTDGNTESALVKHSFQKEPSIPKSHPTHHPAHHPPAAPEKSHLQRARELASEAGKYGDVAGDVFNLGKELTGFKSKKPLIKKKKGDSETIGHVKNALNTGKDIWDFGSSLFGSSEKDKKKKKKSGKGIHNAWLGKDSKVHHGMEKTGGRLGVSIGAQKLR